MSLGLWRVIGDRLKKGLVHSLRKMERGKPSLKRDVGGRVTQSTSRSDESTLVGRESFLFIYQLVEQFTPLYRATLQKKKQSIPLLLRTNIKSILDPTNIAPTKQMLQHQYVVPQKKTLRKVKNTMLRNMANSELDTIITHHKVQTTA